MCFAQFQVLKESQSSAFMKLQAGVHQAHSDFRTCTNVPIAYWKLRQALKGASDNVVPKHSPNVTAHIHTKFDFLKERERFQADLDAFEASSLSHCIILI